MKIQKTFKNIEEAQRQFRVAVAENIEAENFEWLDELVSDIYIDAQLKKDCQLYMELTDVYRYIDALFDDNLTKSDIRNQVKGFMWEKRRKLPANIDDIAEVEPSEF